MTEIQVCKKALGGDFDLIILDLMLPGVDGFEICRQITRSEEYADYYGFCQER